jgi:hypothetical protein
MIILETSTDQVSAQVENGNFWITHVRREIPLILTLSRPLLQETLLEGRGIDWMRHSP